MIDVRPGFPGITRICNKGSSECISSSSVEKLRQIKCTVLGLVLAHSSSDRKACERNHEAIN